MRSAFRSAIVPTARLLAEHLTRDAIAKRLGWTDLEFVFTDVDAKDEMEQAQIDEILLRNGVVTVMKCGEHEDWRRSSERGSSRIWARETREAHGGRQRKANTEAQRRRRLQTALRCRGRSEMGLSMESMAIEMPAVHGHPNRAGFRGVLTIVDVASDKSPSGARGHRVLLTRRAAEAAIPSLDGDGAGLLAGARSSRRAAEDWGDHSGGHCGARH